MSANSLSLLRLLSAAYLCLLGSVQAAPLQCPALDAQGKPRSLVPPAEALRLLPAELQVPVPAELVKRASNIVGFFEHGPRNPWTGVSGQEELSVGFMQWNWRTGSLVSDFLKSVPDEALLEAPVSIRSDLQVLKRADKPGSPSHAQGAKVVAQWRNATAGDPVLKGGLRRSIVGALGQWLATPAVVAAQERLIEREMRKAYAIARRWAADRSREGRIVVVDAQLLAYFFDLVTFNGGTANLWTSHVDAVIGQYPSAGALVGAVSEWLQACVAYRSPLAVKSRSLYNLKDAAANARLWKQAATQHNKPFSDEQLALFALAWLRAQRSTGSDPPRGFPGVYQADVMSRRGTIALGLGQVHGARWPMN